jgi:hypothetical protein
MFIVRFRMHARAKARCSRAARTFIGAASGLVDLHRSRRIGKETSTTERAAAMAGPIKSDDRAILDEIRTLAGRLGDDRLKAIVQNVVDAVRLNPQPLPPELERLLRSFVDAVALNPQPLPPDPPPERGAA